MDGLLATVQPQQTHDFLVGLGVVSCVIWFVSCLRDIVVCFECCWIFVSFSEQFYGSIQFVEFFLGECYVVVRAIEPQQFKQSFVSPILLVGWIVFAVIRGLFVDWIFIGEFCSVAIEWFCIEFWSFRQFRKP